MPLPAIQAALLDAARDARETFGALDRRQLNWRPDAARWSVAQCVDRLVTANQQMPRAADEALAGKRGSFCTRVPLLPRLVGPAMIRSQSPTVTRTYTAPPAARPAASDLDGNVIARFVEQQHDLAQWMGPLSETASRTNMQSQFLSFVAHSVLDGCRLMATHNRRHIEQARRVMQTPGFPEERTQEGGARAKG